VGDPGRGSTTAEVAERRGRGLVNVVTDDTRRTVADIVRSNVLTRFNAILGTLLVVVLATGEYHDTRFGIVLVTNALIGIVQELRAKRTLDRLDRLARLRGASVIEVLASPGPPTAVARSPRQRAERGAWPAGTGH
jgi:magnesium-transporting ATPase (P-type)